jgi:hypothetical protein
MYWPAQQKAIVDTLFSTLGFGARSERLKLGLLVELAQGRNFARTNSNRISPYTDYARLITRT